MTIDQVASNLSNVETNPRTIFPWIENSLVTTETIENSWISTYRFRTFVLLQLIGSLHL
jgi:hypothetical protein